MKTTKHESSEYEQLQTLVFSGRATDNQLARFKELIELSAHDDSEAERAAYRGPLRHRL